MNISLINPCNFAINIDTPAYYDKDSFGYINNTVQWYLDKYVFINGKACPGPLPDDNQTWLNLTSLNIEITSNEKLIPEDLLDTKEEYSLIVYETNITISASQWSGVVRALSTLAQLIKPKLF